MKAIYWVIAIVFINRKYIRHFLFPKIC